MCRGVCRLSQSLQWCSSVGCESKSFSSGITVWAVSTKFLQWCSSVPCKYSLGRPVVSQCTLGQPVAFQWHSSVHWTSQRTLAQGKGWLTWNNRLDHYAVIVHWYPAVIARLSTLQPTTCHPSNLFCLTLILHTERNLLPLIIEGIGVTVFWYGRLQSNPMHNVAPWYDLVPRIRRKTYKMAICDTPIIHKSSPWERKPCQMVTRDLLFCVRGFYWNWNRFPRATDGIVGWH